MNKLIVVVMGDNCTKFLKMCFDSILEADKIIFCWGMEDQYTKDFVMGYKEKYHDKFEIIENKYIQEDLGMNGKQRQFYMNHLQNNYYEEWALCLDADEVIENLENIKEFIKNAKKGLYSVKMRHLINDLAHEDSMQETHYVLNRLFKISEAGEYPEVEHPVLQPKVHMVSEKEEIPQVIIGKTDCTVIWHLAYCGFMWDIKKRYENHMKKSNMHSPEYLRQWRNAHYFGTYPRKQFDPLELPDPILRNFGIERDELYFEKRKNLEMKHLLDAYQWRDFFKLNEKSTVLLCGDGMGQRTYALRSIGIDAKGFDLSGYAVKNNPYQLGDNYWLQDICFDPDIMHDRMECGCKYSTFDLVIAYDILEHLDYDNLDKAFENCRKWSKKWLLISVPVIGDPNLLNDSTHKIKETKEWWLEKIKNVGFSIIETPMNFIFRDQIIIGEKI